MRDVNKRLAIAVSVAIVVVVTFFAVRYGSPETGIAAAPEAITANSAVTPPTRLNTTPGKNEIPKTHFPTVVDGRRWSLTSFKNELGQICAGEKVAGDGDDGGQGLTCKDPSSLFSSDPLVYFVGARRLSPTGTRRWDNVWVWGWAAPSIARIELLLNNCQRVPLPIDADRLFFHVSGAASSRASLMPARLIGYDEDGATIADKPTPMEASAAADAPLTTIPSCT